MQSLRLPGGSATLLFSLLGCGLLLQLTIIYVIQHPSSGLADRRGLLELDRHFPTPTPQQDQRQLQHLQKDSRDQPSIFVSLASYRDSECAHTVDEIFRKSQHSDRIVVGICQAVKLSNESCVGDSRYADRIRLITLPFFEAQGPTHARHLVSTLYRGEDYWFQLDSHSNLTESWDTKLTAMLQRCPSNRCVLSHYPASDPITEGVPVICRSHLDEGSQMPSFSAQNYVVGHGQFLPTPFSAAGFVFASGEVVYDVPFDPHLQWLFVGEEVLYSARLWTHGWDIYAPDENVVFHHYNRAEKPSLFRDMPENWYHPQLVSNARARYLLGLEQEPPPNERSESLTYFGLGNARSLQQYWEFAGIDVSAGRFESESKFCLPPPG